MRGDRHPEDWRWEQSARQAPPSEPGVVAVAPGPGTFVNVLEGGERGGASRGWRRAPRSGKMARMLLPGAEALDLSDPLAHYRAHGWAPLGRVAAPEALEALRRRADQLMLGEVVQPGLFFQHDAATGRYEDIPRGQGWQGPSLHYRKLEKLELDPLFSSWIGNPLFGRIAHAVVGPEVVLCRAVLFTKAAHGRHRAPLAPGRGELLGARSRSVAADLDRPRRRTGRGRLPRDRPGDPPGRPRHPGGRRHPRRGGRPERQARPVDPGAGAGRRGAAHPQPRLAPLGPERHRRPAPRAHHLPHGRRHPLHPAALAAALPAGSTAPSDEGEGHGAAQAGDAGAGGVGHGARLHGDERLLRPGRREGVGGHAPPGPRARRDAPRHRRHVRALQERGAPGAGPARPPRPGGPRHQVREPARARRRLPRASPAAPSTCSRPATPRSRASASSASTSTTSTAWTRTCPSRRPWAPWPSWCRPARSASSGSPRPARAPSAAPTPSTPSAPCRPSTPSGAGTSRRRSCRPCASSASASSPTARSAAAS